MNCLWWVFLYVQLYWWMYHACIMTHIVLNYWGYSFPCTQILPYMYILKSAIQLTKTIYKLQSLYLFGTEMSQCISLILLPTTINFHTIQWYDMIAPPSYSVWTSVKRCVIHLHRIILFYAWWVHVSCFNH